MISISASRSSSASASASDRRAACGFRPTGRRLLLLVLMVVVVLATGLPPGGFASPIRGMAAAEREQSINLHFTGNRAFTAERLQAAAADELRLFRQQGRRTAIDDAAYLMQLAYRRVGYHLAVVDYEIREDAEQTEVFFQLHEGPQVLLERLLFHGNTVFPDQKLATLVRDIMRGEGTGPVPFVESRLSAALSRLRELYLNEGYREVRLDPGPATFTPADEEKTSLEGRQGTTRATVEITINEGRRWLIRAVELAEAPPAPAAPAVSRALATAKAELLDQPYFTRRKLVLRSHLLEALQATGYPEALVRVLDQPGTGPGAIVLQAEIDSGPQVVIEEIEISGNRRTSTRFINRRLHLTPGTVYDDRQRRASFRELYGSGLFSRINFELEPLAEETLPEPPAAKPATEPPVLQPEQTATPDSTAGRRLRVEVEETSSRELFLAGGWGSYEMLRLRGGYTDRNLFGHGRILRLETGGSMKGAEVQAAVTDPWLFETPTKAEIPIYYRVRQEPSFTRTEVGLGLLLSRELPHRLTAAVGYRISQSDLSKVETEPNRESEDPDGVESGYSIASLKFQLSRDTRNDIFFPTAGHRAYGALEVADKNLGGELSFYRFTGGWRQFLALSDHYTLGLRADTGLVIPGRDHLSIPLGERFFNGGENSVRSFREGRLGPKDLAGRPVGGMGFNTLSVELRRRLGKNLALSLFADYGNLSPNLSRAEEGKEATANRSEVINATLDDYFTDFRPGLGVGLQYLLPVGPARLDMAFNPDRQADRHEPDWVIHFSLGMAF